MAAVDFELFSSLVDQLETTVSSSGGRHNLPIWIEKNTRSPTDPLKPWSFKDHEYQLGILNSTAAHIAVQKASQRGVSELLVRVSLALLSKLGGVHGIYILPSTRFATKFTSSRFDPVIDSSPRLKRLASKIINSTELKQIGSSFLHIGGASKESQAISIPAKFLIVDEYSFCNPDVVSVYQSRLGHNAEGEEIMYSFSTPLHPRSGITDVYERGTQKSYMVFHDACSNWVEVSALEDIVIPGFEQPLVELSREDLLNSEVLAAQSWVKCRHCGEPISRQNMADPERRAWVPRYPDRAIDSFCVDALSTPGIAFAPHVVMSLSLYKTTARWVQYALGYPYESSDTQILPSRLEQCFTISAIPPEVPIVAGAVAGMDVGKVSHLCHGKLVDGRLEIFNMETVRQDELNATAELYVTRMRQYRVVRGVIDAAPDVTIVKSVQGRTYYNAVWGAQFVRGSGRSGTLDLFEENEVEGVVKIKRTQALDEFVKEFNTGRIRLPKGLAFETEVREQLERPKRIVNEDAVGEEQAVWVSKGADHWFFSLFYCWLAAQMAAGKYKNRVLSVQGLSAQQLIGRARLKTGLENRPASL